MPKYYNPGASPVHVELPKDGHRDYIVVHPRQNAPRGAKTEIELEPKLATQFLRMGMLRLVEEEKPAAMAVAEAVSAPAQASAQGETEHPADARNPASPKKRFAVPGER